MSIMSAAEDYEPARVERLGPGLRALLDHIAAELAHASEVSSIDPTPAFAFGHGLSYTRFDWTDLTVDVQEAPTDGEFTLAVLS